MNFIWNLWNVMVILNFFYDHIAQSNCNKTCDEENKFDQQKRQDDDVKNSSGNVMIHSLENTVITRKSWKEEEKKLFWHFPTEVMKNIQTHTGDETYNNFQ